MTASPISTKVAKEFLTSSAAAAWDPSSATITYTGSCRHEVGGDVVGRRSTRPT